MKKFEFESNGSKWLLFEADEEGYCFNTLQFHFKIKLSLGLFLKDIKEEQASEVVGERQLELWQKTQGFYKYYDYMSRNECGISFLKSSIESLHSLLKSKGVHLYKNTDPLFSGHYLEAEAKTFYNPVLFKIICN